MFGYGLFPESPKTNPMGPPNTVDTNERPFVLIWEVTQACDLECEHCRADAQPERHPQELSTAAGKALLREAARFDENQLVVLSGGDPLARPDIPELIEYGTDLGLRMTLTPSGTSSLDPAVIDDLDAAGLKRLAVSLDGSSPANHDTFRGEPGTFEQTVTAAEYAGEQGIPLQVNTTVSQSTVDDLPAIADLVEDLGAVLWSVFFLVPIGRGRLLEPVSPERAESVMEWLLDQAAERSFGVKTTEAPHYRRVAIEAERSAAGTPGPDDAIGRRGGVRAGDGFAFVSHTGAVYPSGFLPLAAGSVRESSLVDIYRNSELFQALRDEDRFRGKCGACSYRTVCGGSRSRAYADTGDPFESDPLCPYVPPDYEGDRPEQAVAYDRSGPAVDGHGN
ncbi:TIGR04053 family radical SAM/SPASM domain-containing protein [Halodesulfurarchaeum formicicum]|uniref:Radical SAM protein n=1 Tax=Halodesulfurarchaeum formicicum TaxID=1873524 RepID=A0A1J1ADL1_9EURY|nr:radical SAM protein [Halodesulfurarchaeum formicicum]